MKHLFSITIIALLLLSCNGGEKIEGYKSNEILVVTLKIEDNIEVEKIILKSNQGSDSITKKDLVEKQSFKLKVPQKGEGTFSICILTSKDTLCSADYYAEGGFRPVIKLKDNKFETEKD